MSPLLTKFFQYEIQETCQNCSTTRAKNFKSHYWLKVVKHKLQCKFHNKYLTVVEQHIKACEMLSFGFETCIKANPTLVNRLINDTLLDA